MTLIIFKYAPILYYFIFQKMSFNSCSFYLSSIVYFIATKAGRYLSYSYYEK